MQLVMWFAIQAAQAATGTPPNAWVAIMEVLVPHVPGDH